MKETLGTLEQVTWRSLIFQLLAVVVFPLIVLLLIITFGSSTLHENAMRDLVRQRDERAARMASVAIEDLVQRRADEIQGLAGSLGYVSSDQAGEVLGNPYLQDDFDAGLAVFAKDGTVIAQQGGSIRWEEQPAVAEGLKALAEDPNQRVYLSDVIMPEDQQSPLMMVMASTADGSWIGAGAFSLQPLMAHVAANLFAVEQESAVTVVAADGRLLFQQGFGSRDIPVSPAASTGAADAPAGNTGTTSLKERGSEYVVAYSTVLPFGWTLLLEESWAQNASPLLQTTHMAPLVMAPVALLALLAIFFGIRQIIEPLQTLAVQSSKLGWGDYQAIETPVGGISEIRQLQQELIHMAHKVRAAQQNLHSYIGAITSGQEEERRRLARELHDDTIQSLIAFKQRVQLVEMDWEEHPVGGALNELELVAEQTIENLRRMVSALRPIYLEDLGLVAAIHMLAAEPGQKADIAVDFTHGGKERRFEAPVELALYRIVQEALSNITRHSGATHAAIRLAFLPDQVCIEIEDNGKGFPVPRSPAEFAPSGHFGLLGMFERADLIGGTIRIESKPEQGTRLVVNVPGAPAEGKKALPVQAV